MNLFKNLLSELEGKLKNHGSFILLPGESINDIVNRFDVPSKPGVYIIYGYASKKEKVIYIGSSGRIKQDGSFGKQTLKKRLTMKQCGEYRRKFFGNILAKGKYSKLLFKWFITFDSCNKLLPANIEGDLMQAYHDDFKCLPEYNKSY